MFEAFRALFSRKSKAIAKRSYDAAQGGYRWRETGQTPSQVSAMLAARDPIARRSRYAWGISHWPRAPARSLSARRSEPAWAWFL